MNIKTVLKVISPYLLVWLAFMLLPSLLGQPEVICATPFGLILTLCAGLGTKRIQLTRAEAVLAGMLVGIFQGLLFGVWVPLLAFKEEGGELIDTLLVMSCLFVPGGVMVGGLLGAILGAIGHGIRAFFGNVFREKRAMPMEVTKAEVTEAEVIEPVKPCWSPETTEAPEELPEDERTVPELIQALSDQSAKARARAALALGAKGDKQAVPHLIQALGDKSPKVREAAAWALGRLGDEQAVPHLIQALNDKRWQMRAKVVEALGRIGDKSTLPHLVRALNDRKSGVRMVAARALAQLGDKRAVPHLAQALNANKGRVLLTVGWALGRLGALSELSRALKAENWKVREAAVVGLSAAGWKAVPFLLRALNDDLQEVREQAAVALNRLGLPVRYKKRQVKLSPAVLRRIRKDFPPQSQAEAIALVERYLERDREHGRNLVYKIVVLSEGSIASLSSLTETALADYRDVLYFWEVHKRRRR